MIAFMKKHDISITEPVPVKAVLLERICQASIQKEYVIDKMAKEAGFVFLRLPPYYCVLNPIALIRKVFAEKIPVKNWRNYVQHVIKEEGRFKEMDNIVDDITGCRFQVI